MLDMMFTKPDVYSKHTRIRYKIRAQQQQETFGVVSRRLWRSVLVKIKQDFQSAY